MITTILILIASVLFTRRPNGVLGCGIVAFVPNKKSQANLNWIKMLFLANTRRGTDSCGIWINEQIKKGVKTESDALTFMANNKIEYENRCKNRAIMAHARKSTFGAHTEENAHPFQFTHEGRSITLVHNGSLTNHRELAKEYEVDITGLDVDSQILAKIILERGYGVLDKYKGSAALVFAYSDEPNVLYAFKGASKDKWNSNTVVEERPLYLITDKTEGVYISSMYEPLDAVCNQEIESLTFVHNQVTRIKDNELEIVYKAKREDVNIPVFPTAKTIGTGVAGTNSRIGRTTTDGTSPTDWKRQIKLAKASDIYFECTYSKDGKHFVAGGVYMLAGRYYSIPYSSKFNPYGGGIKHPAANMENMEEYLLQGEHWILDNSTAIWPMTPYVCLVPPVGPIYSSHSPVKRLFHDGVMIDAAKVYRWREKGMDRKIDRIPNVVEKLKQLSSYSQYPTTYLFSDLEPLAKKEHGRFYHYAKPVDNSDSRSPVFSNRQYVFGKDGHVLRIYGRFDSDEILSQGGEPTLNLLPALVDVQGNLLVSGEGFEDWEDIDDDEVEDKVATDEKTFITNVSKNLIIYRFRGASDLIEKRQQVDERWNGLANAHYFLNDDDSICVNGQEIKKEAIRMVLEEVIGNSPNLKDEEWMQAKIDQVFEEGDDSQLGLIAYMDNEYPSLDFGAFLAFAAEACFEEAMEDVYGSDEEEPTSDTDDEDLDYRQVHER